jgi:hypothetical protein
LCLYIHTYIYICSIYTYTAVVTTIENCGRNLLAGLLYAPSISDCMYVCMYVCMCVFASRLRHQGRTGFTYIYICPHTYVTSWLSPDMRKYLFQYLHTHIYAHYIMYNDDMRDSCFNICIYIYIYIHIVWMNRIQNTGACMQHVHIQCVCKHVYVNVYTNIYM